MSQSLVTGTARKDNATSTTTTGWRIPAAALESLVRSRLTSFLASPADMMDLASTAVPDALQQTKLARAAAELGEQLGSDADGELRRVLIGAAMRIAVHVSSIELTLDRHRLIERPTTGSFNEASSSEAEDRIVLSVPATLQRAGNEMRFVIIGDRRKNDPDPGLLRIIARAHVIRDRLFDENGLSIDEIARQENLTASYITRLLRLTFLSPDILARIVDGDQPSTLTATKIMADTRLPLDWTEQRIKLGFAA